VFTAISLQWTRALISVYEVSLQTLVVQTEVNESKRYEKYDEKRTLLRNVSYMTRFVYQNSVHTALMAQQNLRISLDEGMPPIVAQSKVIYDLCSKWGNFKTSSGS